MIVKVKHSSNTGNTPVALANGELALNAVDQLLYYRHANGALAIIANGASLLTFSTAQISSNLAQIPSNTSAYNVTFNSNDLLIGANHSVGNSRVTVLSSGWYQIVASGNYLRTSGKAVVRVVDCWIRRNNVDVTGTTTRVSVTLQDVDTPMLLYAVLRLDMNDYVELIQAIDSAISATGLQPETTLAGGPALRSVALSITKLAN
jgi:hypothetical protein